MALKAIGDSLVGLSPSAMGCDALSRWIVSELSYSLGYPADVPESCLLWRKPLHTWCQKYCEGSDHVRVKEKYGRRTEVFPLCTYMCN